MQLRKNWIRRKKQQERMFEYMRNVIDSPCDDIAKLVTLYIRYEICLKMEEDALNKYHKYLDKYIARKLDQLDPGDRVSAEKEIKNIKLDDDWIGVFDVLKKYGVQI